MYQVLWPSVPTILLTSSNSPHTLTISLLSNTQIRIALFHIHATYLAIFINMCSYQISLMSVLSSR